MLIHFIGTQTFFITAGVFIAVTGAIALLQNHPQEVVE